MPTTNKINWCFQIIVIIVLSLLAGCSIHPIQAVVVSAKSLQGTSYIPLIKLNDGQYENIDNGNWNYGGQIAEDLRQGSPFRVKYHPSYYQNYWMVVEGKLGNGRKYPLILDTGASPALFVNDIHILENKLAIYPLSANNDDSTGWGICHLPKLHIGEVTLLNWPCFYREQHLEIQLFGLPIARDKAIIAGLPALLRFKYIAFDSANKEVELSLAKTFEPGNPKMWARYAFVIEEDLGGNAFLFVKIPIAGEQTELQLDTGSGRGLAITEELWERMSRNIHNVKLSEGRDLYPYIGWLVCKRGVISRLEVGDNTVKDAKISIFPNDNLLLDQCQGLLGMQYFRDTVMVLDFERNLMWVKGPKSQQRSSPSQ